MINPEIFLSKLEGVRPVREGRWRAICPSHKDAEPSLQVTLGRDGDRLLVRDWGGCGLPEILAALGLQTRDLFEHPITRSHSPLRQYRITRTIYDDAHYLRRFHLADRLSGYQLGRPTKGDRAKLREAAVVMREYKRERGL